MRFNGELRITVPLAPGVADGFSLDPKTRPSWAVAHLVISHAHFSVHMSTKGCFRLGKREICDFLRVAHP